MNQLSKRKSKNNEVLLVSNMFPSKENAAFGSFVYNHYKRLKESFHIDKIVIDNHRKGKKNVISKYLTFFLEQLKVFLSSKKYQIIHFHYVFPTALLIDLFKFLGSKTIVTVHGGDVDNMAKRTKLHKSMTKHILNRADCVQCVSDYLKSLIVKEFEVNPEKVVVFNMGIDESFLTIPNEKTKNYDILFVGNFIKSKGVIDLFEALKNYPQLNVCIVGSLHDKSVYEKCTEIINKYNLNVEFTGVIGKRELKEYYSASKMLILPSHNEGAGLVTLEAMASGLLVLGSNVGGLSELLAENRGILFEAKNANDISSAIKKGLTIVESEDMDKITKENMKYARSMTISQQVSKVERLYKCFLK
ncbi:glycosyltransferase family 4 protein [Metabacillus dongyingensis]|uniref:glycosyltransferase family 4 protein n=1 Tax=Metabacillus dongyingensis TaxID=2874282 RepID=UPI001CBB0592|nr:glycosyltransferase family 4 protein [Metabacillus dongyingensis]UAL52077.1 glycosyltransferase family 4 protein [Metabacillus dongyingensis]